jgi:hypothetical protein
LLRRTINPPARQVQAGFEFSFMLLSPSEEEQLGLRATPKGVRCNSSASSASTRFDVPDLDEGDNDARAQIPVERVRVQRI